MKGKAAFVAILVCGIIVGGCAGWLVGTELGRWATHDCSEMECLLIGIWQLGGVLVGIVVGTLLGLFGAGLARGSRSGGSR